MIKARWVQNCYPESDKEYKLNKGWVLPELTLSQRDTMTNNVIVTEHIAHFTCFHSVLRSPTEGYTSVTDNKLYNALNFKVPPRAKVFS